MKIMRAIPKWLFVLVLIALLGVAVFATNQQGWFKSFHQPKAQAVPAIEQFYLGNGMEVIVIPNHRVPAISHMLWIKAGAGDDPQGKSGLAHYLEHLMFKGTKKTPDGEYSKRIEALGGQYNAFTSADFTGYYVNIAKEHLPLVMELESDRMQGLLPPLKVFKPERDVIIEERKGTSDNKPAALLEEQIAATLFQNHPYRMPIIGWLHEMKTLSPEDAKAFYDRYYHAANMILVVAGDITRAELEPLANRYYGGMKKRAVAPRNWTQEPPHRAAKRVVMVHPQVRQLRWSRVYLAPSLVSGQTRRALPLEVLSQWLGGGETSQLYRELVVDKKLATQASASYSSLTRGPSEFRINVVPAPNVSVKTIEQAVDALLARVKTASLTPDDLKRTQTLLKADAIYAQDGLQQVAYYVGYLRVLGLGLEHYTQWAQDVDAITAQQVRAAANAVFKLNHSVTGILKPKAGAPTSNMVDDSAVGEQPYVH